MAPFSFQPGGNVGHSWQESRWSCRCMTYIYNKLAELQRQIHHPNPHMNTGDTIQIEAPAFDP